MNVITTCNYRFQEVLYLINVRVRVRTGSSIGLPTGSLAIVYCESNTNTHNELFILSWDVNYCTLITSEIDCNMPLCNESVAIYKMLRRSALYIEATGT